jgi:hypothetical protein
MSETPKKTGKKYLGGQVQADRPATEEELRALSQLGEELFERMIVRHDLTPEEQAAWDKAEKADLDRASDAGRYAGLTAEPLVVDGTRNEFVKSLVKGIEQ